ncbi:dihydroxyacetone kinase family protein [Streptomyces benahoarensis]|uniref:Dihydroxyacetone kinase family protein n=1 Tax=Streptomyces benahoarensis TaxID=2595054 RepID=A0A553ZQA0_9ACTN|nr:dihydroxyacetone kinase family protein [Streptomyces benahoarensis]TSB31608.1 dihydroxyacetone kinase family protein [Streptomyces benahoarensis]TSB43575.1 dihydroxyacetone kinase family protein [Streptomyces benahoarensis]
MTTTPAGSVHHAETFREDWLEGLADAYARTVRRVPGAFGVVGRHVPRPGKVAVVIGGGSGHYPAFAGLVGPGLADAAAIGDVFASPSAEQVYRTARAADGGAGVLMTYGNYAGDVMHFGLAARRLAAEGTDVRTVLVTDDVASGPPPVDGQEIDPSRDRRGVAGDFFVFKIAGASADRGDDLGTVARLAAHANAMTRTFGAAFAGCTLPGAAAPLFTVEPGTTELGMGIHGEPGLRTAHGLTAAGLADALVDNLLAELPRPATATGRVAVLLNGLGRTKYEEMFVVYRQVNRRLRAAGLQPYRPEVGEFVTSFDMAGVSLSLMVLDDELTALYDAPCDTPAFRSLPGGHTPAADDRTEDGDATDTAQVPAARTAPGAADLPATAALQAALDAVAAHEDELGRLDAVAGDGDHGIGIVRGLRAAVAAARATETGPAGPRSAGAALLGAGLALADASGGASGALYGALLAETGAVLAKAPDDACTTALLADAADAAHRAVAELGGARVGEKTLLDALEPFRHALRARTANGPATAWRAAAGAATRAAAATADLVPARGRAARMGDLGLGHPDAGATSLALLLTAVGETLHD